MNQDTNFLGGLGGMRMSLQGSVGLAGLVLWTQMPVCAADFTVTTPGAAYAYTINGMSPNPVLTLTRGKTYTFTISTSSIHPFEITNAPPGSVLNNNISSGT